MAQGQASSSRPERVSVKGSAGRRGGFGRHLEGWQLAVVAVLIAGSTALLAVPRPVDPVDLPEPRIDLRALQAVARADEALAAGADQARLDVDVLELGTAIFAYGEADATGDDLALGRARRRVLDAAQRAVRVGAPALLALRAHHLRSFLQEIRRWERTGEESVKLRQLAGGFLRAIRRNGWATGLAPAAPADRPASPSASPPDRGAPLERERPRLLMDQAVLSASFKKHWSEVTGLQGELFALTLDEARAFYRFVLQHPSRPQEIAASAGAPGPAAISAELARASAAQYRLKKLDELGAIDPSFPVHLARGVELYQLKRYPQAVEAFRRHLEASPDGPLTLRAQNYLRAALGRAREE